MLRTNRGCLLLEKQEEEGEDEAGDEPMLEAASGEECATAL